MLIRTKKAQGDLTLLGTTSIIGANMTINGDIFAEGDIRIDGKLIGGIKNASKVVVGEAGLVEGNINAHQADITGKILGNLAIKDLLNLRGQAIISGNISAGKISMEPSVSFNGNCTMQNGTHVVDMHKNDERKKAAEQ